MIIEIIIEIIIILIIIIYVLYKYFMTETRIHKIYGKVAKNDKELQKGLMFRKDKLKYNEGMLFPMTYKKNSMWMKNTYIPLDIIFLDDNMRIIGYVEDTVPLSLDSISIDKKSHNVLEMNAGSIRYHNKQIGDKILFIEREL